MRTQVHRQRGEIREFRDGAKADLAAASLGDAVKLCVEATGLEGSSADSGERSIFQDDGGVVESDPSTFTWVTASR
jgi:hypothetical protein